MPGRALSKHQFRSTHGPALAMMVGLVLLIAFLSLWTLARTASRNPEKVRLGTRVFEVGRSKALGPTVDANGPLLFQDLVTGDRRDLDVFVQHLGGDRWVTFQAFAADSERTCQLRWQQAKRRFTDPCRAGRTFPADGAGLTRYRTTVDRETGKIVVDLNSVVASS